MTVAMIPAYNEEPTVAGVVRCVVASQCFERVIVIDDGSKDRTAEFAKAAGAEIISPGRNLGKGGAMVYALKQVPDVDITFYDADLFGIAPRHIHRMMSIAALGYDMVCGFSDRDPVRNMLQVTWAPVITGQRFVRRWVLDAVPPTCWSGYSIETAINDACLRHGAKVAAFFMTGMNFVGKMGKTDYLKGFLGYVNMYLEMKKAREALDATCGAACSVPKR